MENSLTNAVIDCIHGRRSTRQYTDQQISTEQLDALLDAAIWAPSGGNNQTWLFTAIQNQEILHKLNELVREGYQTWVPDDDYPSKHSMKRRSQQSNFNFSYNAPTLIIASNRPNYQNAMTDCSLAMENIFLTVQSLGLGSCYINHLHWLQNDEPLRAFLFELGIPRKHTICSAASIGHIQKLSIVPARKDGTINIIR